MFRKTLTLFLAILLAITLPVNGAPAEEEAPIRPLILRRGEAEKHPVDGVEPYSEHWFTDKTIQADLSGNPELAWSLTFADDTRFPEKERMPAGFDPKKLLEWGMDPGLNVDILHRHGFTGKGAVIAYVDQPYSGHPAYAEGNIHYRNNSGSNNSMHGPAVLSLLAGKGIGTAPDAEIYYYAHAAWKEDQTTHAECLYQIIEQNQSLPEDRRIRMVGFSDNIDETEANAEALREAVKACEDAGIMVWFCGDYMGLSFVPMSDKNSFSSLTPSIWDGLSAELVFVPSGGRTTAATEGGSKYIYWASGGLSWTMPYVLGLYAVAIEIDPTLTQDTLRALIVKTAETDGIGRRIINPVGFIEAVLDGAGRAEEAELLRGEVRARTRYLYAVMDTSRMSEADLAAVNRYLAFYTDETVLLVDAARFADAQSLYTAMRQDAEQRGGQVAGVQIFGTPDMVPSFEIGYRVQMASEVHEGGTLLTDLFYGNFENDAEWLSPDYNVLDHMAEGRPVNLVPQWPVARLPLGRDRYEAFFEKYTSFVRKTGLERQPIVNFSNPIFAATSHIDDMGLFLRERMDREFRLLDVPYRLYGNLKGDYPVTGPVEGGFEAVLMTAENEKDILEFIINTHGQRDNIDNAIFTGGQEQRISLVNMGNINTVLGANPYYLDAWTCLNGEGMSNNLTTAALEGQCVGMFSATAIISNNGVNWKASLPAMKKSNFYYFYYNYLKALHEGAGRSQAFFTAQREYAQALLEDSRLPLRTGEGNVQFNLYNLLSYHNFGVLEPNAAAVSLCSSDGVISRSQEQVQRTGSAKRGAEIRKAESAAEPGNPQSGKVKKIKYHINDMLSKGKAKIHSYTAQKLDNGNFLMTVEFTVPAGMEIFVFNPPTGDIVGIPAYGRTTDEKSILTYELTREEIEAVRDQININFYTDDSNRCFVMFNIRQLK